mmetsp:Transcript_145192/g.251407  ORF Transcript_145192/g.251407 Transcript_145192/m.251407 type:complete len:288 (+) Transcript_145192:115-978(+)
MADRYRGRSDSRPASPPPARGRDSRPPARNPPPPPRDRRRDSREPEPRYGGNKPEQGKYKITVEGIPDDMTWKELKDLGRDAGTSLTFARTYRSGSTNYGMLEYGDKQDADAALRELDNRRVEGSKDRLRSHWGDLVNEGNMGRGGGGGGGYGKYDNDRGRSPPRGRSPRRSPPRRRSPSRSRSRRRSPPRRGGKGGGGGDREEIMTLFVKDLPDDAREGEVADDLNDSARVLRVMIMRKNNQCSAFVRFGSVRDAERAMDDILDGAVKVCGRRVNAEMARRNTDVQ